MEIYVVAIAAGLTALFAVWLCADTYNRLVRLQNQCHNARAQVEVQLKRRYDLIPKFVECVKGALAHERECLTRLAESRRVALAGLNETIQRPQDALAIQQWMGAEAALHQALDRFTAVLEGYPELKATSAVAELMEQLTTTENRIAYARQAYNDWATGFNDYRDAFPACLLAGCLGFPRRCAPIDLSIHAAATITPRMALI